MTTENRRNRLASEHRSLLALRKRSSILDFQCTGDPPDQYSLTFRGRGVAISLAAPQTIDPIDEHVIEVRLPYSFPSVPPDVRWKTPLFHPNVSFSGLIDWPAIGLVWQPDSGIDILCERLWDVARFAHLDLTSPRNVAAVGWFQSDSPFAVPLDARPLRDLDAPRPKQDPKSRFAGILWITEDAPTPDLPIHIVSPRAGGGENELFYIGD